MAPSANWNPTFGSPPVADRAVDHDSAYADRFLLGRYRPSILRMVDEFQSK